MRRLRIGIMCHSSLGGSARIGAELASELSRREHVVHLFTRTAPFGRLPQPTNLHLHRARSSSAALAPGVLYREWGTDEYETQVAQIAEVAAGDGLDVLHYHYGEPFAHISAMVRERLGASCPVVVGTLHGSDVSGCGNGTAEHAYRGALASADVLTTVSEAHSRLAARVLALAAPPLVISNFVDLDQFRPVPWPDQPRRRKPRLVHVSNFRPVKDSTSAARIFLKLRERVPAAFWLVGDGPESHDTRALLRDSPHWRDVRFWGVRLDTASLLRQSDLMLVTSRAESFCLAALEAMACGVPVLASQVGGLPEVVRDGETGLLFPPDRPDLAVEMAVSLLSDRRRYRAMCEAAAEWARTFDQARMVDRYEQLYYALCASNGSTT
jgi:N-acetyl-alpha-D-glucosaminyl L-malate synthase BshA